MAIIELATLPDHLDSEEVKTVLAALNEEASEAVDLATEEDGRTIDSNIDDDVFVDFRDRLEANDLDAEVYVPVEFDDVIEVGGRRVGSTYALQLVLDSLREDFFVEDQDDDETEMDEADDDFERGGDEDSASDDGLYEGEDGGIEMKDEQLRHVWRIMHTAAKESLSCNLSVFLLA
jgi:hypothetical protein